MRTLVRLSLLVGVFGVSLSCAEAAEPSPDLPKPVFRGVAVMPQGLAVAGTPFGGISGLDYDAERDVFYAISDDRSELAPARFYELKLKLSAKGIERFDIAGTHILTRQDGTPFTRNSVDPEAIRYDPASDHLFWSSEGGDDAPAQIVESDRTGRVLRQLDLPQAYRPGSDNRTGVRPNLSFEGLALSTDGKTLYASTENALIQDGDKATFDAGSLSRILSFDLASGRAGLQETYLTEPIFARPVKAGGAADNGISELLDLDADHLIAVERSYVSGVGNRIAFYVIDLAGAAHVDDAATAENVKPAAKHWWFTIGEGDAGFDVDNIEAVSWGPTIEGERSLIIASDNNFNARQITEFALFTVPNAQ